MSQTLYQVCSLHVLLPDSSSPTWKRDRERALGLVMAIQSLIDSPLYEDIVAPGSWACLTELENP